jgi:predicted porin
MQKKLIALAVAGLVSGGAFAQSNVTIYGVADVTFDFVKSTGATAAGFDLGNRTRVSSNSSLIGFKGSEDLGNGVKALFQFESSVAADVGGGPAGGRDTYAGLTGGFGTVVGGLLTGPTRALGAKLDPFAGATGITVNGGLLGKLGGGAGASTFDTRWSNAVAYISPSFSGLTATGAYVSGENKTRNGLDGTGGQANTKGYDIGLNYENGPIVAGITYNAVKFGDIINSKTNDLRAAFKYDFGVATVGLLYDRVKEQDDTFGSFKRTAWFIPVTFSLTPNGKIIGQFGKAGNVSGTSNTGAKQFSFGYEHALSKRTLVKAVYSQIKNKENANYDFGTNAVTAAPVAGADPQGFQFGIRHTF